MLKALETIVYQNMEQQNHFHSTRIPLLFKIGGKLFALAGIELFASINLKCDPERSLELRETYSGIKPGFHMNKKHWNTLTVESDVPNQLLFELIDHSLDLVYKSLTKKIHDGL